MEDNENVELYYEKARRKAKTNIVWFGIFSIVMMFAGLTSAYIVSKGDNFWVNFSMPKSLWISTAIILLSSITMVFAVRNSKKENNTKTTAYLILTLVLGVCFGLSQYFTWTNIYDKGYSWADKIVNPETGDFMVKGEYGKDYTIEFQGNELIQEEDGFYFWGEEAIKIDKEEYNKLSKESPSKFLNKEFLRIQKKTKKKKVVLEAILKSKMKLSESYAAKLKDVGNVSSSYFYTLTILHLAHILAALLYLISMVVMTTTKELTEDNQLKIKLGGYFWHFFAGLWLYLLLFLFLIH